MGVKPMGDRVLIKREDSAEEKKGSLYIPDSAKEKPQRGTVMALGTGPVTEDGKKIDFEVKVGDTVLFGKYSGTEIKVEGEELIMMHESDILAIIS